VFASVWLCKDHFQVKPKLNRAHCSTLSLVGRLPQHWNKTISCSRRLVDEARQLATASHEQQAI
jgi:hypothetical protein